MSPRLLVPLFSLLSSFAWAQPACAPASRDCVEVGKWQISVALGAGVRTNPVMTNKDIPLIVLPEVHYQGERFFVQNLDFGAIVWENDQQQLNLLVTPGYDQVFFHRWSPGNFIVDSRLMATSPAYGEHFSPNKSLEAARAVDMSRLHKRRMAALAGFEYGVSWENWFLQSHWLYDVSKVHGGQELRLALSRQFNQGKHSTALTVGSQWQSEKITDYYYGIRREEVNFADDAYRAGSGLSAMVRADWQYALNDRWTLRANASYKRLASEVRHSPIVTSDHVTTVFIGGVYHF